MSKKAFIAVLVCVLFASSIAATIAHAQTTIPTPSAPEFSLQLIDFGVQITIQNQPPNVASDEGLYYNIRMKNHNSATWINLDDPDPSHGIRGYIKAAGTSVVLVEPFSNIDSLLGHSNGAQIDFQAETIKASINFSSNLGLPGDPNNLPLIVNGTSGWSNTQTITIPEPPSFSPSPSESPSATPELTPSITASSSPVATTPPIQPNYPVSLPVWVYVVIAALTFVIVVLVGALVVMRRRSKGTGAN